jgi:two-component system, cell cycle sensor histidine kinase PleC
MPTPFPASLRSLPRVVAIVGLAAIALVTGLVAYLQMSMGRAQIVEAAEKFNQALTVALAGVVSSTLTEALALERVTGEINPEVRRALDSTFAAMGARSRVLKVKLYNLGGATIYSTNAKEIGQSRYDNPQFRTARQGMVSTGHGFRASFTGIAETVTDRHVAFTYLPLRAGADKQIGVVEIYADITDEIAGSNRSVVVVLAVALPCLLAFYGILLLLVARHARAIGAAHQRHVDLTAEAARANAASDAKTHFLMTVSHELRTPLNAVIGFSEMIKDQRLGPIGNARYAAYAGDIHGAGTHLLSLINEIIDATALHERTLPLSFAAADCVALAGEVLETLRPLADERAQTLSFSCAEGAIRCRTDARRFRQILYNLAGNAVKYAGSGRAIAVALKADPAAARVALVVADDGPGIAAEDLQKCLTPFGRAKDWSVSGQGLGLGLSLSKSLAEALGGTLDLSSTLGRGTVVTVTLPLDPAAPESAHESAVPAPGAALRAA